jgi:hypothetical protein
MQEQLGFVPVAENMPFSLLLGKRIPHIPTWLGRPRWRELTARRERLRAEAPPEGIPPAPTGDAVRPGCRG